LTGKPEFLKSPLGHSTMRLPDLRLDVDLGPDARPWNLNILLYRGGADADGWFVQKQIEEGKLGTPLSERLDLAVRFRDELNALLATGARLASVQNSLTTLRHFYGFGDRSGRLLTLESVTETYQAWADSLVLRTRLPANAPSRKLPHEQRPLGTNSAYHYGSCVGKLLDSILQRHTCIIETTRLEHVSPRKSAIGVQAEKQNLERTFAFGHFLREICEGLTLEVIQDTPLPFTLRLSETKTIDFKSPRKPVEHPLTNRHRLASLRIEAELLMFIGQTSMNLDQAYNLQRQDYFYVSHLDGYQVKDRKHRRGGEVLFEIFTAYKEHFERYLEWREKLFPNSTRLFPLISDIGIRPLSRFQGDRVRTICKKFHISFVPPRSLRNTRVNWMLRRTGDPEQAAETAQHAVETLASVYVLPSLQRTMIETTHFWRKNDPHVKVESVAPGDCAGTPKEVKHIPKQAPKPDCLKASGCLWCENHRDVDSFDYVWGLASFRQVKVIELSKARSPHRANGAPPAMLVIDRIVERMRWFEQSNRARREWVLEAEARRNEGNFHPDWQDIIDELEGIE
jgi:hypothetical protein